MKNLDTFYNVDARSFMNRNQAMQDGSSAGRVEMEITDDEAKDEETELEEPAEHSFEEDIASLAMSTMMQMPYDVGLTGSVRPEDLDPSQYKDEFIVPMTYSMKKHGTTLNHSKEAFGERLSERN